MINATTSEYESLKRQDKGRKHGWNIQNTQHDATRISRKRVGKNGQGENINEMICITQGRKET